MVLLSEKQMKTRVAKLFTILKTTAIGGIFFLLPLVVVGALLAQVAQVVWIAAAAFAPYMPFPSVAGYSLLLAIAVLIILLLCFLAGMAARRSLGRRITESIEKYLLMLFPRYAIFKEQLTGNIGGEVLHNQLRPVLVEVPEGIRLAMEVERSVDGLSEWITVYFPGSPDPWSGTVVMVPAAKVTSVAIPFSEALATVEQLGRGSQRLLKL